MKFLRKLREKKELSSAGVARALDINIQSYRYYESEAEGCKLAILCKLKKVFNISWAELGRLIDEEYGEVVKNKLKVKKE